MTKCDIEHSGHPISRQDYYSNAHVKKLNPDDFDYVKMLPKTKAKPRNIADLKSQKMGKDGSTVTSIWKLLVVPNS